MCIAENCLSLCCLSVCFYFDLERLQRKWFPPGKKLNGGKSCTGPPINILVKIEVLVVTFIPEGLKLGDKCAPGGYKSLATQENSM
jgi:hypothetical protein